MSDPNGRALATRPPTALQSREEWDDSKRALLARTIAKGATSDELELFIAVCKRTGLDPFLKQIYFVKYGNQVSIQVAIDGYRVQAERSGKYAGQVGPQWCGTDGVWHDVWLEDGPPTAARVAVLRSDFSHPVWAVCRFKSYVKATDFWRQMPDQMLGKCAESLAFRKAFPRELMGLDPRPVEEDIDGDAELDGPPSRAPAIAAGIDQALAEADALMAEPVAEPPDPGELPGPRWGSTPLGRQVSALVDALTQAGKSFSLPDDDADDATLKGWIASKRGVLGQRA